MKIKKNRVISLTQISKISKGNDLVIALVNAMDFKDKLFELGFSLQLNDGERILPRVVNPSTARNAERFFTIDKMKPKEKYFHTFWWHRKQWAGYHRTIDVDGYVVKEGERYHRNIYEPYCVEFSLKYNNLGELMVITDPIKNDIQNEKLLINTINIFLTLFGECDILTESLDKYNISKTIRLNWEVLPKGKYPWKKIKNDLINISQKSTNTKRRLLLDKCEYINSFKPSFMAYGKAGFSGYIVFGFEEKNIFVFESIYDGNATYVFNDSWKEISKFTKAQILKGELQKERFIHIKSWQQNIKNLLEI